jgi:hypothetical protein
MTFARLILEIRRRAASIPEDMRTPAAIEKIAREVLDFVPDSNQAADVRRILAGFLGIGEGEQFDAVFLDQMTPELIFRLDMIAAELLELGRTTEAVRALRGALIRSVN